MHVRTQLQDWDSDVDEIIGRYLKKYYPYGFENQERVKRQIHEIISVEKAHPNQLFLYQAVNPRVTFLYLFMDLLSQFINGQSFPPVFRITEDSWDGYNSFMDMFKRFVDEYGMDPSGDNYHEHFASLCLALNGLLFASRGMLGSDSFDMYLKASANNIDEGTDILEMFTLFFSKLMLPEPLLQLLIRHYQTYESQLVKSSSLYQIIFDPEMEKLINICKPGARQYDAQEGASSYRLSEIYETLRKKETLSDEIKNFQLRLLAIPGRGVLSVRVYERTEIPAEFKKGLLEIIKQQIGPYSLKNRMSHLRKAYHPIFRYQQSVLIEEHTAEYYYTQFMIALNTNRLRLAEHFFEILIHQEESGLIQIMTLNLKKNIPLDPFLTMFDTIKENTNKLAQLIAMDLRNRIMAQLEEDVKNKVQIISLTKVFNFLRESGASLKEWSEKIFSSAFFDFSENTREALFYVKANPTEFKVELIFSKFIEKIDLEPQDFTRKMDDQEELAKLANIVPLLNDFPEVQVQLSEIIFNKVVSKRQLYFGIDPLSTILPIVLSHCTSSLLAKDIVHRLIDELIVTVDQSYTVVSPMSFEILLSQADKIDVPYREKLANLFCDHPNAFETVLFLNRQLLPKLFDEPLFLLNKMLEREKTSDYLIVEVLRICLYCFAGKPNSERLPYIQLVREHAKGFFSRLNAQEFLVLFRSYSDLINAPAILGWAEKQIERVHSKKEAQALFEFFSEYPHEEEKTHLDKLAQSVLKKLDELQYDSNYYREDKININSVKGITCLMPIFQNQSVECRRKFAELILKYTKEILKTREEVQTLIKVFIGLDDLLEPFKEKVTQIRDRLGYPHVGEIDFQREAKSTRVPSVSSVSGNGIFSQGNSSLARNNDSVSTPCRCVIL